MTALTIPQPVLDSVSSPEATAWPHGKGQRHVLQIGTGYLPDADCTKEVALKALQAGVKQIAPEHIAGEFLPNWIETSLMDINEVNLEPSGTCILLTGCRSTKVTLTN